ncbi:MAG: Ku protein [Candidatus Micrarchaeia archaeon]
MKNKALWRGKISFGLVNIPVRIYPLAAASGRMFTLICREHLVPVHHENVCESGHRLQDKDIVFGVKMEDRYIPIEKDDLEKMRPLTSKRMQIIRFLQSYDVDEIYLKSKYYIVPMRGNIRAYSLLRDAMGETGLIGFGKVMIRKNERYAIIKPYGKVILMYTLYYPEEIKEIVNIPANMKGKYSKRELDAARELLMHMQGSFSKDIMKDEFRDAIKAYLSAVKLGKSIPSEKDELPLRGNLLRLLRKSIRKTAKL